MDREQQEKKQRGGEGVSAVGNILSGLPRKSLRRTITIGASRAAVGLFANPYFWIIIGVVILLFVSTALIVGSGAAPGSPSSLPQKETTTVEQPTIIPSPTPKQAPETPAP